MTDIPVETYKIKMWYEGLRIVGGQTNNGTIKKYHFEEPYEDVKEVTLSGKGNADVSFELVSR